MRPSRRQTQPFIRRWSAGRPSATTVLVALSVGAYAAQWLLEYTLFGHEQEGFLQGWLALNGASIREGRYWTSLTYPFLHLNPLHLLANMFLLYFAGKEVEPIIGARHFVALFGLSTLLGGLAHWLALPDYELMGSTPAVAATIVAFTTILPELEVIPKMHLLGVLPLHLRAKYLAVAIIGVAAILWQTTTMPEIGPAGIIAASAGAWLYIKQLGYGNPLAFQRFIFQRRQRTAQLARMSAEQFIRSEVDPILDKISRDGLQSLSRTERKLLAQGREKIAAKTADKP